MYPPLYTWLYGWWKPLDLLTTSGSTLLCVAIPISQKFVSKVWHGPDKQTGGCDTQPLSGTKLEPLGLLETLQTRILSSLFSFQLEKLLIL